MLNTAYFDVLRVESTLTFIPSYEFDYKSIQTPYKSIQHLSESHNQSISSKGMPASRGRGGDLGKVFMIKKTTRYHLEKNHKRFNFFCEEFHLALCLTTQLMLLLISYLLEKSVASKYNLHLCLLLIKVPVHGKGARLYVTRFHT